MPFQYWLGKTTASTWAALLYTIPSPTQLGPVSVLPWVHQPHERHCYSYIYTQTYPTMPCFSVDLARLQQPQEQHCYTYLYPVLPMSAPFLCLSGKDHSSHNSSTDTHVYTQSYPSVPRFCVYLKRPQQPQASCALYPSMACFCLYLKRPQQPQRQGWYT